MHPHEIWLISSNIRDMQMGRCLSGPLFGGDESDEPAKNCAENLMWPLRRFDLPSLYYPTYPTWLVVWNIFDHFCMLPFQYIGNNHPNWLFFRGVETTIQPLYRIRSFFSGQWSQIVPGFPSASSYKKWLIVFAVLDPHNVCGLNQIPSGNLT